MVKYEKAIKKVYGITWYVDSSVPDEKIYIWDKGDVTYMDEVESKIELRRKIGLVIAINRWDVEVSTQQLTDKIMDALEKYG